MENMCRTFIVGRRIGTAILFSTLLQYILLTVILLPVAIDVLRPDTWIRSIMDITIYSATYLFPLATILLVEGLIWSEDIEAERKYFRNRFSLFCSIFSVQNMLMAFFHSLIGGFFFYLYVSLVGGDYGKLSIACNDSVGTSCLVESYLYLISCGFWMGFYFYLQVYVFGSRNIMFPVIQQSKLQQLKSQLKPTLKQALLDTLSPTIVYGIIYYWKGDGIRHQICEWFYLRFEDDSRNSGIIDAVYLLFCSWLLSALLLTTMYTVRLVAQIHVYEHMAFPVTPTFGDTKCATLHQALCMKKLPTLMFLGYQDLKILAENDIRRREELFSLSQPGGHPHNWNAIIEDCLKLISEFTAELNLANSENLSLPNSTKPTLKLSAPIAPAVVQSPNKSTSGIRNLTMQKGVHFNQPVTTLQANETVIRSLEKKLDVLREAVLKKPGINYIFGELPETKVRHVLSKGQLVVMAVESLAVLASASFHEDKFGVVQKDLPAMITALLQLKQILDKLQKAGSYKRSQKSESYELKIKHGLKSSVKRSLYRITVTFGGHLKELQLPDEFLSQIESFILFKE